MSPTRVESPNAEQIQEIRRLMRELRALVERQDDQVTRAGSHIPISILENIAALSRMVETLEQGIKAQTHEQDKLRALVGVGRIINSSLHITNVLNQVMDTIIGLTGAERGFLMLKGLDEKLVFRIARDRNGSTLQQDDFEISKTIIQNVERTGNPILTTNAVEDPRFEGQNSVVIYNLRSILCVPLKVKDAVTGVIYADNRIHAGIFQESDLHILAAFADQAAVAIENARLFEDLQKSKLGLENAYDATLAGWAHLLDLRDEETEGHTLRVTEMTEQLARRIGIPEDHIVHIRRGALLHDIGKMGIPDAILNKPGPLTEDEQRIMRLHPVYAKEFLSPIDYLAPALDIPYCHHEKWDGTGYPQGLKGEKIPQPARIFALVDVWDALRSERPYKHAWTVSEVRAYIQKEAGAMFDPKIVEFFLVLPEFQS